MDEYQRLLLSYTPSLFTPTWAFPMILRPESVELGHKKVQVEVEEKLVYGPTSCKHW